ncbi:MAG: hypothetical protein GX549_07225, partial [Clostridiales bacterium]|nr:hypothetical protein [Clostridiales bacterium]
MMSILKKAIKPALAFALLTALIWPAQALADPADEEDGLLIHRGHEGDNVILLQMRLADLGYFDTAIT